MSTANGNDVTDRILCMVGSHDHASDRWTRLAGQAFVDTVAVLVAGAAEPSVRAVAASIDETGGSARSLVTGKAMSERSAALIDGTGAHALDYDDVDDAVIAHPSAVLIPALLATGGRLDASGTELVDAYRTGVRVGRLLAAAIDIREHYEQGWHSTATIGTIMAAASVAQLQKLTIEQVRHALGIAGSLAAGSRRAFGTMTKPLHAGTAAGNGVFAAQLAKNGLTGDPDLIGAPLGFLHLHAGRDGIPFVDLDNVATDEPTLNVKLFPCCYYTHSAIEAAFELARQSGSPRDIECVEVTVQPGGLAPLVHQRPTDGSQAKFSMEYVIAAALLDGRIDLTTFDDKRVQHEDVQQFLTRVRVSESEKPSVGTDPEGAPFSVVAVHHKGGTSATVRVDRPAGHATRPITAEQLRHKFDDCTASAEAADRDSTYRALSDLSNQPSTRQLVDQICRLGPRPTKETT